MTTIGGRRLTWGLIAVLLGWAALVASAVRLPGAPERLAVSRLVFCGVAATLAAVALRRRRRVQETLQTFFHEADAPLNLAVFRIALFATIFWMADVDKVRWFSGLPETFRMTPYGARWWLLTAVPITPAWATAACATLRVACVTAMLGLWSRTSAAAAAVLALYVLGIPQFFGKVDHYHHLVWFAALLAASPCGDALSLDALIAAWRRAGRGRTEPPAPSAAYARPIRFAWLLIGLIYFFPGFWKWWKIGIDWAWSENLKFWMYAVWSEVRGWTPAWRIDQSPLLYRMAGLSVIVFELGFLWCLFRPRLRWAAAAAGLLFHNLTSLFMRIQFLWLQTCYVIFVDWAGLLRWAGRRAFRQPLAVLYDGNCTLCRRTIALLRAFDWFERVTYLNALDEAALVRAGFGGLDRTALLQDMHAVLGGRRWLGYDAYRAIAWRLPLLWPLLPCLYLPPVAAVGRAIYRRVADHRVCEVGARPGLEPAAAAPRPPARLRLVTALGIALLAGNAYYGVRGLSHAWPLACYPTFAHLRPPEMSTVSVEVVDAAGGTRRLEDRALQAQASRGRWRNLLGSILTTTDAGQRQRQLQALWTLWARDAAARQGARRVRFYKVTRSIRPEQAEAPPLKEELLWDVAL